MVRRVGEVLRLERDRAGTISPVGIDASSTGVYAEAASCSRYAEIARLESPLRLK